MCWFPSRYRIITEARHNQTTLPISVHSNNWNNCDSFRIVQYTCYRWAQLKLDRRFGGWGKGKGKAPHGQKGKGKASRAKKGKGKGGTHGNWDPIPLGNQTARTHARTKRNDFPVEHPQTSDEPKWTMMCFSVCPCCLLLLRSVMFVQLFRVPSFLLV